ncbi:MAG: PEGA domain-containing protein [Candidatus Levybacteria bacterium]|nr:PEGA domain-containing protein [Candidatus Levybacteria bacterium]
MRKQLLFPFSVLTVLIIVTIIVVFFAQGYRINVGNGTPQISKTGILVVTSKPDGAQVLINDELATATDNTLDLTPGDYTIKIIKEGYFPWEKKLKITEKLVTKADALLYPLAPKLESITTTGIIKPLLDPSNTKIAYQVASQSAAKNGIYVYDMNARAVLSLQTASRQVVSNATAPFSSANLSWSPDGLQLIATLSGTTTTYLLNANETSTTPRNITSTLPTIQAEFAKDIIEKKQAQVAGLRKPMRDMISQNFRILSWSPDDTRILYTASQSATLPLMIKPRLLGIDTLREVRDIKAGGIYVYDLKEDRNLEIVKDTSLLCKDKDEECSPPINWFVDSDHLVFVHDNQIHMLEMDGTNDTTVYAGPFIGSSVFPWPNGEKLVILTDLNNPTILPNLYTISLK